MSNKSKSLIDDINYLIKNRCNTKRVITCQKIEKKKTEEMKKLKNQVEMDEHLIPLTELCKRLNTSLEMGLSPVVAKQLLHSQGPNVITTQTPISEWVRFLKNMFAWFNILLWIGSALCFITYTIERNNSDEVSTDNLYLGLALIVAVVISGCFSYYQEAKSANILFSFRDLIPRYATVIRAGSKLTCPAFQLVVGDLVEIKGGDRVPADLRIIDTHGLKVVNNLLYKSLDPFTPLPVCTHTNPLETKNLVFFSTYCVEGIAHGIVIRTGDRILMSHMLTLAPNEKPVKSHLMQDTSHFIHIITCVSIAFGLLLSGIAFLIGYSWLNAIIFMIALIVAQVPEGLFPTVTVVLTSAAKKMTSKNCLVKNLEAVKTLGLTSIIITDKTGTLTQNHMIVSHIWCNNSIIDSDNLYTNADELDSSAWKAFVRIGCLCGRAEFSAAQARLSPLKRKAIGDATEVAILRYMEIIVGCVETYRKNYPKVFEVPFNSNDKYSITVNKCLGGHWFCMKGAPEIILEKCSTILIMDKEIPLNEQMKKEFHKAIEEMAILGERIIGFCDKFLPCNEYPFNYPFDLESGNYPMSGLRLIGLISLINPPRPSVPDAVLKCRSSGIKIIMITGDHPITAKSIARAVGIISDQNQTADEIALRLGIDVEKVDKYLARAAIIEEKELKNLTDEQIDDLIYNHDDIVFARTSPQQKLRIVESCRKNGPVVAVTGEGVEDSSVLRKADINIAMGMTGSDLSKQAADIILLDDNFASIVTGIEEGRVTFDNLKKSICYTLSSKTPEITPFVLFLLLDIPLALGAITILCIDLGTDMIPAISLAYEAPENDVMKRKPRDLQKNKLVSDKLVSVSYGQLGMFQVFAGFFSYLVIMSENGFLPSRLLGLRICWDSVSINDLMDSYGQEWTYHRRKTLEYTCYTAFFASVVITKWSALICCKTRKLSIFQQGMKNDVLTFSMFFELGLAIFLSYCPGLDKGINMYPLKFIWWFCAIPFALLMILYDEMRRFLIRLYPNGWIEHETYY